MNTVDIVKGAIVYDRLKTLSAFIRAQANLTDGKRPQVGPGDVHLNHEEALLCADALDAVIGRMKSEVSGGENERA